MKGIHVVVAFLASARSLLPSDLEQFVRIEHNHLKGRFSQLSAYDIPKIVYIAQTLSEPLTKKAAGMYERERNAGWKINLVNDSQKDSFIEKYYFNTSTYWAYNKINPIVGVSKADLWRFAQLYLTGGVYLDIDTYIGKSFGKIISAENSTLVIGSMEKHTKVDECFIDSFHLSSSSLREKYGTKKYEGLFSGPNKALPFNCISISPIFVVPGHPIILSLLKAAVEIIYAEYSRQSVINSFSYGEMDIGYFQRWKQVLCTTGPNMALAAVCEAVLQYQTQSQSQQPLLSVVEEDFRRYDATAKLSQYRSPPKTHYTIVMTNISNRLLVDYQPLSPQLLENACLSDLRKSKFWIFSKGKRHPLRDWDQFLSLRMHRSRCASLHPSDLAQLKTR